jgi:hypothetical protein
MRAARCSYSGKQAVYHRPQSLLQNPRPHPLVLSALKSSLQEHLVELDVQE